MIDNSKNGCPSISFSIGTHDKDISLSDTLRGSNDAHVRWSPDHNGNYSPGIQIDINVSLYAGEFETLVEKMAEVFDDWLEMETCYRDDETSCFCCNCRTGAGMMYLDELKSRSHQRFNQSYVLEYITGSGHGKYSIHLSSSNIRFHYEGSRRSYNTGAEYAFCEVEDIEKLLHRSDQKIGEDISVMA